MKPLHYVQKYNLDKAAKFSHDEFMQDFTTDFLTLLEVGKTGSGEYTFKGFENTVRAIRMKWDGINNKTFGELPEGLWKYFYATVVIKMKKELFPDEMEQIRRDKEESKRQWEQRKRFERSEFNESWFDMFSFLFKKTRVPEDSFLLLSLSNDATEDQVKKSYKILAKKHHPDMGGKQKVFIDITEAKNKCLTYINNK